MDYRLLVDLEVVAILDSLPARIRRRLLDHLARLRLSPEQFSDDHTRDNIGRRVKISIADAYAIHYWIDFPDRHIKALAITGCR